MTRKSRCLVASFLVALSAGSGAMAEDAAVHVTQPEAMKAAREKFAPEYPSIARQLHLEGAVQLKAYITEAGTVDDVKPMTGNAVLMNAAVLAVKRWKFTPFTSDGKPSRAIADMSFTFHM